MVLDNCDKELFVSYFGEEGYKLIKPYDIRVILLNNEMEQAKEMSGLNAWVCNWLPAGSSETELALFVNVERIYEQFDLMERLVAAKQRRIYVGTLVHELTHVRQMQERRLISYDDHYLWEGKRYEISSSEAEYFAQPWEIEAYIEQGMYVYEMNREQAEAIVSSRIKAFQ